MGTFANGLTTSFKEEIGEGIHVLSTDTLKIALYDDNATITKATTAYSATNEVSGTGYSAGGATMTLSSGYPVTNSDGNREYRFDAVTWSSASFTARAALIYNSSKSNRSIRVIDFGQNRQVVTSDFIIRVPTTLPAPILIASG
jgi:predicted NAD/FAD-binding protein